MTRYAYAIAATAITALLTITGCGDTESSTSSPAASEAVSSQAGNSSAAKLTADFKTNFGNQAWGMTVTGITIDGRNARVHAQIDRGDKDTAEKIQRGAKNLVSSGDYGEIDWVIVEDGAGTVVTQTQV